MPQFFVDIAIRQKRENPFWYRTCPICEPDEIAEEERFSRRTKVKRKNEPPQQEPELQLPLEEGPKPTADDDTPF